MRQCKPSVLLSLLACLVFCNPKLQSQCDTTLTFRAGQPSLRIAGLIGEGDNSWSGFLALTSPSGGQFTLRLGTLMDEWTNRTLSPEQATLSTSNLSIGKGETEEVTIAVAGLSDPGVFSGSLLIYAEGGECSWDVLVTVDIKATGQVSVWENDRNLTLKTASPSWLNGILPHKIRNREINFRLENTGRYPIGLDRVTLALKGDNTGATITEEDIRWATEDKTVAGEGIKTVTLALEPRHALTADQYQGLLRLHFSNYPAPVTVSVNILTRIGVGGAILALLLGIVLGRIIKDVDKAQDQLALMDRLIPLRARVDQIHDGLARSQLTQELDELEARINQVAAADQRAAVEAAFEPLEQKVQGIRQLEILFERVDESLKPMDVPADKQQQIELQFRQVRDYILAGEEDNVKEGLTRIHELVAEMSGGARGGLLGEEGGEPTRAIDLEIDKIHDMLDRRKEAGAVEKPATFWQRAERLLIRVLAFFSGIKVTARVRYALFRPLIGLATFLIVVLIGFQEIYIQGGDTFGAEGIYDYLKLFLWGVISDVFSRTLVGDQQIAAFAGK